MYMSQLNEREREKNTTKQIRARVRNEGIDVSVIKQRHEVNGSRQTAKRVEARVRICAECTLVAAGSGEAAS